MPTSLRFHPSCRHASGNHLPAMIAHIQGVQGFAVHRTYLTQSGQKAKVIPAKAMLGGCKGGSVRLAQGGNVLAVSEGIETGLSLASGILKTPATIWAALSASGIESLSLPATPSRLIIASDSDDKGAVLRAAQALAQRASGLGWDVSLLPAPAGQDWNDYLNMKGGAE
ncbi:hypothetical protein DA792_03615 [Celeribacter baekdonensis]|uniref:Uncharacterized protein n=2 Tax=Celeribacter baekdonensis TaxID=875171 RepID=A0A2R4LZD9_9RHOB|nr:hypothetical protein DA792_03615 [Celeribacter baekdonensis]